ncbi:MAG: hypothetical protein ABIN36_16770 [Ferruginibacter sp.]
MGNLIRFDLGRLMNDFNTPYFFETGTFMGDGIAYAQLFPFKKIYSAEIIPEIALQARKRFKDYTDIDIIVADSITALKKQLPLILDNIIFWLDAHFPGADAGLNSYDEVNIEDVRLPLQNEIETICNLRKGFNDVFILDDLRIYEDGDYEKGNVPPDALPAMQRNIDFIYKCFSETHFIFKSYLDEGYILLFPKKRYRHAHFKLMNIFQKKTFPEDHYMTF